MDDVPSGSGEERLAGAEASRNAAASFASEAPDSSPAPQSRQAPEAADFHKATSAAPDYDATIISAPAVRQEFAHRPADKNALHQTGSPTVGLPTIGIPPASGDDGATVISNTAALGSAANAPPGTPDRSGANGILLDIGARLGGRYEVLALLGQGGMGAVYKAADREVDRIVALKVIRPEMASNPEILSRFKQELVLSSQVTDRNVIRIYDLGEAQGVKFITMEFVEGDNLHKILKDRGKLEVAEAVDIMEQVASGLAAAHREGIIHRDLKPANIMVDKSGRVVVMDFGLARTFSGDGMTNTGTMLGTIEYMSPEQAQGMDVKASSDIFTVGLILYELLAGTTPFYNESAIASLLMRTQQRAAPLVNIDKTIPGALSNIVVKCLEKEPAKRYQSAEHLVADLRAWQGVTPGTRVSAPSTRLRSAGLRVGGMRQLPWLRIGIAGTLIVAIAAGSIWYVRGKRQAAKMLAHVPVSVLIGDFQNHTGDSVLDSTLEPMLGVAMEEASFINVYSRGDARKLAKKLPTPSDVLDEQSSRLVAMSQLINAVITGDISRRGDQYEISAIALDAGTGNVIAKATFTVDGKQDILKQLPKIAVPIREALGDTKPSSIQFDKVSGGFTAASLEAVHQDSLGVDEQFAGKFQEAFDSFKKSAELDPHFARAYTGMAAMALNLGRQSDAVNYMKLAMANSDRMTERERYRNQGLYYRTTGDWQNCVAQYTQLVTLYPADRVGQNNLALCYTELRNAPKALEAAKRAVEIVPRGVGQLLNLAFIDAFASDFVASEKEARTALEISPSSVQGSFVLAESQLGQGQLQAAAQSYHQIEKTGAAGASTAADGLADLAAYQGDYAEASRILTQGAAADITAKMPGNAARKYAVLANLEDLQGHRAPALAAIGKALANSQATQVQFLAAMIYVDAGDLPKAQKLATSLAGQQTVEPLAYGKIVAGMIALKRKDQKEALGQIESANSLLDTWIGHYELGLAYFEAGAFTEAAAEFQQCIKRRGEAIELFDDNVPTYAYLPAVYYYQGRVAEGQKNPQFADFYKTYLSVRGQSPDDPLVPEIRRRLGV